jgi:poly(3-hydroxybutyrate) depolymerase
MDCKHLLLTALLLLGGCEISVSASSSTTDSAPVDTRLVAAPWGEVPEERARLEFASSSAGSFQCSLDGTAFIPCVSPYTTGPLAPGLHRFAVRAVTRDGHIDATPATARWRVVTGGGYPGGNCPALVPGENSLPSAGYTRRFVLQLPAAPAGAPVVFLWHWLAGDPYQALLVTGLYQVSSAIVVAPYPSGDAPYTWHAELPPEGNPDLVLFDDILACLDTQFDIDNNRVWSTGLSAGALWTSYLVVHRASRLGAATELSGGLPDPSQAPPFSPPETDVPVLLAWGGAQDVFEDPDANFQYNDGDPTHFSFDVASRRFSEALLREGHFVVECIGDYPHGWLPPDPTGTVWPFLRDHPRGAEPEPNDLPDDLPGLCSAR